MAIRSFEEIDAWKAARELTQQIYEVSAQGPIAKDFDLRDQIRRASVSVMANIAEGFDSQTNREFIGFLGYALRSATEVESHLYVALDQAYISQEQFDALYDRSEKTKNLIRGFMRYLRQQSDKSGSDGT
ncbi:MAG: four helix bundle protein [Salinibacter sp.]